MYNEFFGFTRPPFNNTPDPDFYFESDGHKEALASMIYGVDQGKGFVMITGDVGMGKTLLNQTLKRELGKTHIFIEISNPWSTPEEVIDAIRSSIGIERPDNNALFDGLRDRLIELAEQNRRVILVIDEAHQMSERMIEGIRLLSNIETTTEKLLQIIFIGQNEFAEMMERYSMRQIQQRLFLSQHLESFTADETQQYVRHRLTIANGSVEIFSNEALALICTESHGIPRVINQLCDNALLFAYGRDSKQVTLQDITDSIRTLRRWQKPNTQNDLDQVSGSAITPTELNSQVRNDVNQMSLTNPDPYMKSDSVPAQKAPQGTPSNVSSTLPFSLPLPGANIISPVAASVVGERKPSTFSSLPIPPRTTTPPSFPQNFPSFPLAAEQQQQPIINEQMGMVGTIDYSGFKRFLVPVFLMVLTAGVTWYVLKAPQQQLISDAKSSPFNTSELSSTSHQPTGEPLNLSMASSINASNPNKGKAPLVGSSMDKAVNEASVPSGTLVPTILNYRVVTIPKDGGVVRAVTEAFGLWNETARDLIYVTNPQIISTLDDIQSGSQLKIPVLSRDSLVIKTPNGGTHIYYGSFASAEETQAELQVVRRIWSGSQAQAVMRNGSTVYRIFVGPFVNKSEANTALESMWFKHLPTLN